MTAATRATALHPRSRTSPRRAFTLIEILVVVVILGILAAVVVPRVSTARQQALHVNFKTNLMHLASAATLYHQQHGALPPQGAGDPVPDVILRQVTAAGTFPLETALGGYWHVGQFTDISRWGVGVWWPGTTPTDVFGNARKIDVEIDDGLSAAGRFQERDGARYYWLIE